jgi:hypothetical protein
MATLDTRLQRVERALLPHGQECWVTVECYPCMGDTQIAAEKARQIRAVLGRDLRDDDVVHVFVAVMIRFGLDCPPEPHHHVQELRGGVVPRR